MRLSDAPAGYDGCVTKVTGSTHFLSRAISIGIVEGSRIHVLQNEKGQPVLLYCRDSELALTKKDCEGIELSEYAQGGDMA